MGTIEPVWLWGAGVAIFLAILLGVRLRSGRSFAGWLSRLSDKAAGLDQRRNTSEAFGLLRQLYSLAYAAIAVNDEPVAYQTIDLIKAVYGQDFTRPDEAGLLAALAVRAVHANQPDITAAALDAFRLLVKRLPPAEVPAAAERLTSLVAVTLRARYNFLAAKTCEVIFTLLERPAWEGDQADAVAAIRSLNTSGALILRRHDGDLFRETITRLDAVLPARVNGCPAAELAALTGAWLHRIVQNGDQAAYGVLAEFVARRGENGLWPPAELAALVKDWHNLAGTASLRPGSKLAPAIAEQALRLALVPADLKVWDAAVAAAGQTARLAIQRHGLKDGFALALPLLTIGRELLDYELQFVAAGDAASFRQQAIFLVVRESIALADFTARQDMITTIGDILADFYRLWAEVEVAKPRIRAAKRFCQLLAVFWLQTRGHKAKKSALSDELTTPEFLSDNDKQRLGFLP